MIDFRYHLVSIVAIFLALTIGIVLGTTLLQDPALNAAKKVSEQLTTEKQELRTQLDALRHREAGNDSFVAAVTPKLVAGTLSGQSVLLVEAPGAADSLREQQQAVLERAGAKVVGRISVTDRYLDPKSTLLDQLAGQLKPGNMTFPSGATPYEKAAAVLGGALMWRGEGTAPAVGDTVISAFETAGLISVDQDVTARATLAVLFAPETLFTGEGADLQAGGAVALASGLDQAGRGAVVTATAAATGSGGVLAALRDDGDAAKAVSGVDTLDLPAGRVVVVYALQEQLSGGAGQYGVGRGSSAFQPAVADSSATPTPTTSGS